LRNLSAIIFLILLLSALLMSCAPPRNADAVAYVDLNKLSPLPTPINNKITPLKVAIAAVISPQGSAESYELLLEYLSSKLDRPVEAIHRRTYMEINDLLLNDEVDLAFVCTSSYLVGKHDFGMQLLVAPMVHEKVTYRAKLIIPGDSSAKGMADLRGKVFAFTDPISFTGRMYPTYLLHEMGETPEKFFERAIFTYSHDDAIDAVAQGLVDGASVDSLVLDFAMNRDPELASRIQIIHTSESFGIPPVVVGPQIRPQLKAQLEEILLNMHNDEEGLAALQALDYDRFVPISDEAYRSTDYIVSRFHLVAVEEP
jgi:phosphonate transport system substrate-binding protein